MYALASHQTTALCHCVLRNWKLFIKLIVVIKPMDDVFQDNKDATVSFAYYKFCSSPLYWDEGKHNLKCAPMHDMGQGHRKVSCLLEIWCDLSGLKWCSGSYRHLSTFNFIASLLLSHQTPQSCLCCLSGYLSINTSVSSQRAGNCTIYSCVKPAHPALPFPVVTGGASARLERGEVREWMMRWRGRHRKRKNKRVSAWVLFRRGSREEGVIRGNLFKEVRLLTIWLLITKQRQGGNLFFLLSSNKNKGK